MSASTQNQALSALTLLYRVVLGLDIGTLPGVVRAREPHRLPVVLDRNEVRLVLEQLRICTDPRRGPPTRYHLHESAAQRAVTEAARRANMLPTSYLPAARAALAPPFTRLSATRAVGQRTGY